MEITRPALDTSFGLHAWIDRRRGEFDRTSTAVRVMGAVGWAAFVVSAVARLG
jgi:phage tail sheath protein FI